MSAKDVLGLISDAGVIGLLVTVIWGGARRVWVWGWAYEEAVSERDRWRDMALAGTQLAERGTTVAEKAALVAHVLELQAAPKKKR